MEVLSMHSVNAFALLGVRSNFSEYLKSIIVPLFNWMNSSLGSEHISVIVPPCHIRIIQYSVEPNSVPGLNQVRMVAKRNCAIRGNSHPGWKLAKIAVVSIKFGSPVHAFRKCIRIAWRKIEFFRIFEVDHRAFVQLNEFIWVSIMICDVRIRGKSHRDSVCL